MTCITSAVREVVTSEGRVSADRTFADMSDGRTVSAVIPEYLLYFGYDTVQIGFIRPDLGSALI
jgi:hypothetical protein